MNVVGIMNGTSLDGIDFVLTEVNSRTAKKAPKKKKSSDIQIKYIDHVGVDFSQDLKEKIKRAVHHELKVDELALLHHELGREYSNQLKKIVKKKKWKFALIGLHGQTVFHAAPKATLQIGESSYLSNELSVPVISDFRVADLAVGGQGAPIASLFHKVAFQHIIQRDRKAIALHNIGGISNLTLVSKTGGVEKAFDTGPGNMLMDVFVQKATEQSFDKDGNWASQGIPDQSKVEEILKMDFFQQKPPKSFGREEFGEKFLSSLLVSLKELSKEDQLATLAEITARSIAHAYKNHVKEKPGHIVLCGGGSQNLYLRSRIQYHLPDIEIKTTEDFGWPPQAIEGAAFALLAAYKVFGLTSNLPETTGATKEVSLGKITQTFI